MGINGVTDKRALRDGYTYVRRAPRISEYNEKGGLASLSIVRPVLDRETVNPREFTDVVGHQNQPVS